MLFKTAYDKLSLRLLCSQLIYLKIVVAILAVFSTIIIIANFTIFDSWTNELGHDEAGRLIRATNPLSCQTITLVPQFAIVRRALHSLMIPRTLWFWFRWIKHKFVVKFCRRGTSMLFTNCTFSIVSRLRLAFAWSNCIGFLVDFAHLTCRWDYFAMGVQFVWLLFIPLANNIHFDCASIRKVILYLILLISTFFSIVHNVCNVRLLSWIRVLICRTACFKSAFLQLRLVFLHSLPILLLIKSHIMHSSFWFWNRYKYPIFNLF